MKRSTIFLIISKNRVYYISIFIVLIIVLTLLPSKSILRAMSFNRIKPLHNKTIIVDPGHGGIDGGTYFDDILEKDINLEIGLKLKEILIKKGAKVVMTREIDDSLDDHIPNGSRHREDLEARVKIANDNNADIIVSIHVNYSKNASKMGPIVFYYLDSEKGKLLADHIQNHLNNLSSYKKMEIETNHQATPGNYYVLRYALAPGVIIENGFISNKIDRTLLQEEEHQNDIVQLISKGIIEYIFKNMD